MSKKNYGFGGFWVSWWGFCHCNPTYDTFLEYLGPWEYSGIVSRIFGHHQDDQEGQECPKTGLESLGPWKYSGIVPGFLVSNAAGQHPSWKWL